MVLNLAFMGLPRDGAAIISQGLEGYCIKAFSGDEPHDAVVCAAGFGGVLPSSKIAVTLSCGGDIMRRLRDTGCTVVTCGTASDDTLSVSSIGEGKAAVSLQRRLMTLGGRQIEPCEIPIKAAHIRDSRIIPATAALLLLADIPPEKGYEI